MLYMLTAGKKALADAGITEDVMNELNKAKCGVLIGSAMGGMKVIIDFSVSEIQVVTSMNMKSARKLRATTACSLSLRFDEAMNCEICYSLSISPSLHQF